MRTHSAANKQERQPNQLGEGDGDREADRQKERLTEIDGGDTETDRKTESHTYTQRHGIER